MRLREWHYSAFLWNVTVRCLRHRPDASHQKDVWENSLQSTLLHHVSRGGLTGAPMSAGLRCMCMARMHVAGGWLYQEADSLAADDITFTPVSEAQPTQQQLEDLKFAWRLVKHVKSNAITVAKDGRLLGMGSGQPNRVKSVDIALEKAGTDVQVWCLCGLLYRLLPM